MGGGNEGNKGGVNTRSLTLFVKRPIMMSMGNEKDSVRSQVSEMSARGCSWLLYAVCRLFGLDKRIKKGINRFTGNVANIVGRGRIPPEDWGESNRS